VPVVEGIDALSTRVSTVTSLFPMGS
jgi:hypothetical protein